MNYTYEERNAIAVLRKAMVKKPEIITELMKGQSKELASRVLLQARDELNMLLAATQAFAAAAKTLVDHEKAQPPE